MFPTQILSFIANVNEIAGSTFDQSWDMKCTKCYINLDGHIFISINMVEQVIIGERLELTVT